VVGSHEYGEILDQRIACSVLMLDFVRLPYLMLMYLVDFSFFTMRFSLLYSVW
jgi:hypothetical protein